MESRSHSEASEGEIISNVYTEEAMRMTKEELGNDYEKELRAMIYLAPEIRFSLHYKFNEVLSRHIRAVYEKEIRAEFVRQKSVGMSREQATLAGMSDEFSELQTMFCEFFGWGNPSRETIDRIKTEVFSADE